MKNPNFQQANKFKRKHQIKAQEKPEKKNSITHLEKERGCEENNDKKLIN